MGDICKIKTGETISKELIQNNPGPYAVINSGREPLGFYALFNAENDPLGITSRGAGVGSVTWSDVKYFRGNLNYGVTVIDNTQLMPRYLYFWLNANQHKIHDLCTFEAIPALNKVNLEKLLIPVPNYSEQEMIVAKLEAFTEVIEETTGALPAEIVARRQQYDYYRNKLLTFKELKAS